MQLRQSTTDRDTVSLLLPASVRLFLTISLTVVGGILAIVVGWGLATSRLQPIDRNPPLPAPYTVDLNEASWPELIQLRGIGPTLGQRIVSYREREGDFRSIDDLIRVPGIGPRILDGIRPHLVVHAPPSPAAPPLKEPSR